MEGTNSHEDARTARTICDHLSLFKDNTSYSDVVVSVGRARFYCHRILLASVSEFFATAFTSDRQVATEGRIRLQNVDEKIFSALLTCIYSGKYVLTDENLFAVWKAADVLKIPFLLDQCREQFAKVQMTEKTCVDIATGMRYICKEASLRALEFIVDNFSHNLIQSDLFRLNLEELKFVVSSQKLEVQSEDEVLEAISQWFIINCGKIDATKDGSTSNSQRPLCGVTSSGNLAPWQQDLVDVIGCCRYMLTSRACLHGHLVRNSLKDGGQNIQDILTRVSDYLSQPHLHQTWCPPSARHRERSELQNVLLTTKAPSDRNIKVLNPHTMEWGKLLIPTFLLHENITDVICHNSKLYLFTAGKEVLTNYAGIDKWHAARFAEPGHLCDVGDSLYVYRDAQGGDLDVFKLGSLDRAFDGGSNQWQHVCTLNIAVRNHSVRNVTSINDTLISFHADSLSCGYLVVCFRPLNQSFLYYKSQLGSSSRLVTFRHGNEVFALQENGCLWRLRLGADGGGLQITQEMALWYDQVPLSGAVLYNDQLMIVGEFPNKMKGISETLNISLDGVFQSVVKVCLDSKTRPASDMPGVILAAIPKSFTSLSAAKNDDNNDDDDDDTSLLSWMN
ncbi:kelch-like protein diablo [Elysia marginata]|uniref:Kelch-like protein diablo n=1 Tax=Elysia marginata TaxID=1093978 RepID=A0AAV4J9N9_9GAST|nr:kelch-like protein diablo [Elysia marginata]